MYVYSYMSMAQFLLSGIFYLCFFHNYLLLVLLGLCCCMDFSLVVVSGDCSHGLLIAAASLVAEHRLWVVPASVAAAHGLSTCGSWVLEHWLNSCVQELSGSAACGNLPGSGIEPVSPALVGGLFTTEPPGEAFSLLLYSLSFTFPAVTSTSIFF